MEETIVAWQLQKICQSAYDVHMRWDVRDSTCMVGNLLQCSKITTPYQYLINISAQGNIDMECTVSWTGAAGTRSGMGFVAETGSGHTLVMDGAPDAAKPENGGQNLAPRPMETVLAGTGGCTAYDVVLILKRGRHDVRGCSVKLTTERADTDPKVFTKIHMHFSITGKNLPSAAIERAIAMSHEKYCSASIMLGKTAAITTSFEVLEA
jgi:putative redox protein